MSLPPFKKDEALFLEPAGNGGWTISLHGGDHRMAPKAIGAYSNASDMLVDLAAALMPVPPETAPTE